MTYAAIEKFILALPQTTLSIQWGADRVFKIGGKMFAVIQDYGDRRGPVGMSFKTASESFRILTEVPGIKPAPYMARAEWVYLDKLTRLPAKELKAYLTRAHAIVASGLPKKTQVALGLIATPTTAKTKRKT